MEASSATSAPFEITRQDHSPSFDPANPDATVWTIYFRTPSGVESFITVPDSQYNAQNVAALVSSRVNQIEQVHALGRSDSGVQQ